ncbi:MAG: hypothetical protein LBU51_00735 [Bacteroidales bacterium]|jgi:hypothetical protein|nr:hypothetical protein [Bacteroidales bacterium]
MAVNITSAYAGEVLEQLLVKASTGNQFVSGGHIRVQPNVSKKFSIPRLRSGSMLQKRKEDPVKTDSKGDFTIDEVYLEPQDIMAFTVFNPRSFEQFWRPFQPQGNLVFHELPSNVQNAMLAEMAKVIDFELGYQFINGVAGAGDDQFFNGILTRIAASSDVVEVMKTVVVPGQNGDPDTTTQEQPDAITSANILPALKSVKDAIPDYLRGNPNLKIFMSQEDADIYDDVLTAQPYKGENYTDSNPERYKGITIVPLAQWPKDVIVAAVASTDLSSNFWAGVSLVDDADTIQIDKLSNPSELYFFKMLMKADTNIVFGEDIVIYDARII